LFASNTVPRQLDHDPDEWKMLGKRRCSAKDDKCVASTRWHWHRGVTEEPSGMNGGTGFTGD
jgi:hypothetical protein